MVKGLVTPIEVEELKKSLSKFYKKEEYDVNKITIAMLNFFLECCKMTDYGTEDFVDEILEIVFSSEELHIAREEIKEIIRERMLLGHDLRTEEMIDNVVCDHYEESTNNVMYYVIELYMKYKIKTFHAINGRYIIMEN